jgi:hypothetical protein
VPRAMARKQQGRGRDKEDQTSKTPPGGSGKGRRRPRKDAMEMAAVPRTGCVIQGRGNRLPGQCPLCQRTPHPKSPLPHAVARMPPRRLRRPLSCLAGQPQDFRLRIAQHLRPGHTARP